MAFLIYQFLLSIQKKRLLMYPQLNLILNESLPDPDDRQQRRRRFLSCSGLGAAEEASAFYDITNGAATTTTTTNSSDNNNDEETVDRGGKQQQQQQQQTPFLLLDCGCCSGQMSMGINRRFLLNEYPPDGSQVNILYFLNSLEKGPKMTSK